MNRFVTYTATALIVATAILIPLSWLLSVKIGEDVHSLLSSEGLRFLFGDFVNQLLNPMLIWLLLLAMAWGCASHSGITDMIGHPLSRHSRQPLIFILALFLLIVGVILLLTVAPQAVLLSSTGAIWPSPFSRALIPIVAFGLLILSAAYGMLSRRYLSFSDVCQSVMAGIAKAAPLLLLYVLFMQLYASLRFVFF